MTTCIADDIELSMPIDNFCIRIYWVLYKFVWFSIPQSSRIDRKSNPYTHKTASTYIASPIRGPVYIWCVIQTPQSNFHWIWLGLNLPVTNQFSQEFTWTTDCETKTNGKHYAKLDCGSRETNFERRWSRFASETKKKLWKRYRWKALCIW